MKKKYKLNSQKRPVRILTYILILTLLLTPVYLKTLSELQENIDRLKIEFKSGEQQPLAPTEIHDKANFKSWMDYRTITAVASMQMELQKVAKTDHLGRRIVNGFPLIAVGSGWGVSVGDIVIVQFEEGAAKTFIIGDMKSDTHTDQETQKIDTYNGSIIEFIVDSDYIPKSVSISGSFSSLDIYSSPVTNIYPEVFV